eukprot:scaffold2288_cov131-Skeletonema_menzelii.AAC.4
MLGGLLLCLSRAIPGSDYFYDDSRILAYVTVLVLMIFLNGLTMTMGVLQSSIWVDIERYYGDKLVPGASESGCGGDGEEDENSPLFPPSSSSNNNIEGDDAEATKSPPPLKQRPSSFLYTTYASPLAFPILYTTLYQLLFRFSPIGGAGNPAMGLAQVNGLRQVVSLFGEIYLVFWIGWLASVVVGVGFVLGEGGWLDTLNERIVVGLSSCFYKQDGRRRIRSQPIRREMNHVAICHASTFGIVTLFMFLYGSVRELVGRGIYLQSISNWSATQAGNSPLQVSCLTYRDDVQSLIDRTNERLIAGDDIIMWSEGAGRDEVITPDMFEWNTENAGAAIVPAYYVQAENTSLWWYNSMAMFQSGQVVSTYYKNHPVPIMEEGVLAGPIIPQTTSVAFTPKMSSLSYNDFRQEVSLKTSMAICFDFDFPYLFHDVSNADIVLGASQYWDSIGFMFWEHNIFRAIENGFTVIKCSEDGITGAVDPYGRVLAAVPTSGNETHLMEVPVESGVVTLYGAGGWMFGWVCTFFSPLMLLLVIWEKIRQKRVSPPNDAVAVEKSKQVIQHHQLN